MKLRRFVDERGPRLIALLVATVITLAGGMLAILLFIEPRYGGKSETAWLDVWNMNPVARREAKVALQAMGTNAVPVLIGMLSRQNSPLKIRLINTRIAHWLAAHGILVNFLAPWNSTRTAAQVLGVLGPAARNAVPTLLTAMKRCPDTATRHFAALSLGEIGPAAAAAVPSLTRIACVSDGDFRQWARKALKLIGPVRTNGRPVALEYRYSTNAQVQIAATVTLSLLDSTATYRFESGMVQPSAATNGSQPIRSQTNRASAAA